MAEMGRLPAVREGAAQGDGPPQVAGIEASPWSSPKERKKAESGRAAGPVAASPGPLSLPSGKGRKGSRGSGPGVCERRRGQRAGFCNRGRCPERSPSSSQHDLQKGLWLTGTARWLIEV